MVIRNLFIAYCMQGYSHTVYFFALLSLAKGFSMSWIRPDKIVFLAWIAQCLIHLLTRAKGVKVSPYTVIFHTKIKETDLMVCGRKHLTMTVSLSPFSKYVLKDNNTCVWYIEYTDVLGSVSLTILMSTLSLNETIFG